MNEFELINSIENQQAKEDKNEKEVLKAFELINTGKWRQLEGGAGRWCNQFLESGEIIVDEELTNPGGTSLLCGWIRNKPKTTTF